VTEDIRALTAALAADPTSLVFLTLGEALRRRGQLDAARKVALQGLTRYPHLPDAHDLYARILADRADYEHAFDEWDMTLRLDPEHVGALKGIGFLYFQAGDVANALQHIQAAAAARPDDEGLTRALERVRIEAQRVLLPAMRQEEIPAEELPVTEAPADQETEDVDARLLLVDGGGLKVGGSIADAEGREIGDEVAALVAGTTREAARTTKLLQLGEWQSLLVECDESNLCLTKPSPETSLLLWREREIPIGQLGLLAERAARSARAWLEHMR
jgi:tetratricopeptide (TPR) repeat protein